ncbi:MAG: T9SS type A sorting domain-containing protein [Candidatus Anstonellaceae archaeon]
MQKFKNGEEVLKSQPIEQVQSAYLYCKIDGKNYQLNLIENSKNNPQIVYFSKEYGEVKITTTLAPIVFINTFENLLEELQKAGIEISRSPALDLITGTADRYYAIVVNATVEKDGKAVVDKYSSRIILINESRLKDINLDFYVNDIPIELNKLELRKISTVTQTKKENEIEKNILVYPNPAQRGRIVNVDFILPKGHYEIYLYDNYGKEICKIDEYPISKNGEEGTISFMIPQELQSGIYHIVIQDQNKKVGASFIVTE